MSVEWSVESERCCYGRTEVAAASGMVVWFGCELGLSREVLFSSCVDY